MPNLMLLDAFVPNTAAGGNCYLCRRHPRKEFGVREKVVDTGIVIDFEGSLGICATCVSEMAALIGLTTERHLDDERARTAFATAIAQGAIAQRDEAEQALAKRTAAKKAQETKRAH